MDDTEYISVCGNDPSHRNSRDNFVSLRLLWLANEKSSQSLSSSSSSSSEDPNFDTSTTRRRPSTIDRAVQVAAKKKQSINSSCVACVLRFHRNEAGLAHRRFRSG